MFTGNRLLHLYHFKAFSKDTAIQLVLSANVHSQVMLKWKEDGCKMFMCVQESFPFIPSLQSLRFKMDTATHFKRSSVSSLSITQPQPPTVLLSFCSFFHTDFPSLSLRLHIPPLLLGSTACVGLKRNMLNYSCCQKMWPDLHVLCSVFTRTQRKDTAGNRNKQGQSVLSVNY